MQNICWPHIKKVAKTQIISFIKNNLYTDVTQLSINSCITMIQAAQKNTNTTKHKNACHVDALLFINKKYCFTHIYNISCF